MVDYVIIGISIVVFFFYLVIILMSIEVKRKLDRRLGAAFVYIIIAILFLAVRRIQQIFLEIEVTEAVPYFTDIVTLVFALLFSLAIFSFYRAIKKIRDSKRSTSGNFQEYKRSLGRKIIR